MCEGLTKDYPWITYNLRVVERPCDPIKKVTIRAKGFRKANGIYAFIGEDLKNFAFYNENHVISILAGGR